MLENYTVIDLEMTGLRPKYDAVLEVGAVRVRGKKEQEVYTTLVYTEMPIPPQITELTKITKEMAETGRNIDEAMTELIDFMGNDVLVGQNIIFDYRFLKQWAINRDRALEFTAVDTLKLARTFLPKDQKKDLESLCVYFGIPRQNAHRALDDAVETHLVFERLKERYGNEEGAQEAFLPVPLLYKAKKQTPATEHQKADLEKYARHFGLMLPKNLSIMTRSEASRQMDLWIGQYGRLPKMSGGGIR